jgi:hypothetical protein
VAPWWIDLPARTTCGSADSYVLLERYTNHDFMARDADDFAARFAYCRNVFEHFSAENTIECTVGEFQTRYVSSDSYDAWIIKCRLLEVERRHQTEMVSQ